MIRPWLILDRDDTILDDPGYLSDPDAVKFLPGAVEGLAHFQRHGWPLVLVTNQSGIGRGYFGLQEVRTVHDRLESLLAESGVELAGIYLCPHAPEVGCNCRKPQTRLAERAAKELGLSLSESVMVGDKKSDLDLGRRIGSWYVAQIVAKREPLTEADGHFESMNELAFELLQD